MAGRRQHRQRERLPKYVYLAKGRYIYIPFQDGRRGKERVLCLEGAPLKEVWTAYDEAITRVNATGTLRWLSEQYQASPKFAKKAERTQRDYRRYHDTIMSLQLKDGTLFGAARLENITTGVIVAYQDKRADAPVTCNRELAYLSLIFYWGMKRELLDLAKVKSNPVKGAERYEEKARERYVEDWEYEFVYGLAVTPHYIRPAMELAYLCRLRKVEVLTFSRLKDLTSEGVIARRRKGSRTQIITWSDRLRQAVAAGAGTSTVASVYGIHDRRGQRILESTFDTAWQRLMVKASKQGFEFEGVEFERFPFHDLKAKGVSDFEGDKQRAAGHRTARAAAVYDRKMERIKPTK